MAATVSIPLDYHNIGRIEGNGVPVESGNNTVSVVPTMTSQDASNTANSAYLAIEASKDDQKTWFFVSDFVWQGGTNPPAFGGGPTYPSFSAGVPASGEIPTHYRVIASPNQPLSFALALEYSNM